MKSLLLLPLILTATTVHAEDDHGGFLFGFGGGRSSLQADSFNFDGDGTAWKAFAGWRFNKILSLEAAYIDAGNASDTVAPGVVLDIEADVWQASLVGSWAPADRWSLYARASANRWESAGKATNGIESVLAEDSGTDFGWGAGVGCVLDRALFRLEYEQIAIEDADADLLTLSIVWSF